MPTGSASEPPLAVALLHGAVRMTFYEASETWYRIATSIWYVSPRRALEQADEISSSFHTHRTSSIMWGEEFLATKRFKVLVSC